MPSSKLFRTGGKTSAIFISLLAIVFLYVTITFWLSRATTTTEEDTTNQKNLNLPQQPVQQHQIRPNYEQEAAFQQQQQQHKKELEQPIKPDIHKPQLVEDITDYDKREALFQDNLRRQQKFRSSANLREYHGSNSMWYLYEPVYPCPFPERIGEFGDHAKWMCNMETTIPKDESCTLLSFGLGSDTLFEVAMRKLRPKCEMHGFDPTPGSMDIMKSNAHAIKMFYHPLGLCGKPDSRIVIAPFTRHWDVQCKTLPQIVEDLNKTRIDVLKIDIEGFEFDAVDAAWNGPLGCKGMVPVGQVEMEIHHLWLREENRNPPEAFIKLMDTMEKCGFRLFSKEPNLIPGNTDAIEVSWVHESVVTID